MASLSQQDDDNTLHILTGARAALTGNEVGKADGEDCNKTAIQCLAESPIL